MTTYTEAEVCAIRAKALSIDDHAFVAICDIKLAELRGQVTPETLATMRWLREGVGRSHDLVTVEQCDQWLTEQATSVVTATTAAAPFTTGQIWGWFLAILIGAALVTLFGLWYYAAMLLLIWMAKVAIEETIKNGVAEGIKASRDEEGQ